MQELVLKVDRAKKFIMSKFPLEYSFMYKTTISIEEIDNNYVAYTDGKNIVLSANAIKKFNCNTVDVAFIILHELLHNILKHVSFNKPTDFYENKNNAMLWNMATDCLINNILKNEPLFDPNSRLALKIKEVLSCSDSLAFLNSDNDFFRYYEDMTLTFESPLYKDSSDEWEKICRNHKEPPKNLVGLYYDNESESTNYTTRDIYQLLKKENEKNSDDSGGSSLCKASASRNGFDGDIEDALKKNLESLLTEEDKFADEQDMKDYLDAKILEIEGRIEERGRKSLGSLLEIRKSFFKVQENWVSILKKYLKKYVSKNKFNISQTKKIKRKICEGFYKKALVRKPTIKIVIAIDTSGSMTNHELAHIETSVKHIACTFNSSDITVIYCDAEVLKVDHFSNHKDIDLKMTGGGGTDFQPVFDYILKNKIQPEFLVYFSDMECYVPNHVEKYQVIWGNMRKHECSAFKSVKNFKVIDVEFPKG